MVININRKEFSQVNESSILQQTPLWGRIKRKQGMIPDGYEIKVKDSELFEEDAQGRLIKDDLLLLIQPLDGEHSIAYVPYGPRLEPAEDNQGTFLEELSETLRPHLPDNCILIRYDLHWESPWARDDDFFDERGKWVGPPQIENQEIRVNIGTQNHNLFKAQSDILPSHTVFVNLRYDRDSMLKRMKPKTRYNIGLSIRRGVRVRQVGMSDLNVWYALFEQTAKRNGLYLNSRNYFESVLKAKMENRSAESDVKLLMAEKNGTPLAAMFLTITGKRGTYLYGASSSTHRKYMATYALQWEAMNISRSLGCKEYDMFGVSPYPDPSHPLYGLYRYKTGFGGEIFHRMGCWDYPLDPEKYQAFRALDMQNRGIHI